MTMQTTLPTAVHPAPYARVPRGAAAERAVRHRSIWSNKPVLREVYRDVYARIQACFADVAGPRIELGAGPGSSQAFIRNALSTDAVSMPWLDVVAEPNRLPFADAAAANLFMVDLLHHLVCPRQLFAECVRVLKPGGRLVIVDMWPSLVSVPVIRWAHGESMSLSIRPLDLGRNEPRSGSENAWGGDRGIARAIFWKQVGQFEDEFAELRIVERSRFSTLLWPLSGGFDHKSRVPAFAASLLQRLDRSLEPFARWIGFRCMIVLQRC